jgi:hypothetical protein
MHAYMKSFHKIVGSIKFIFIDYFDLHKQLINLV